MTLLFFPICVPVQALELGAPSGEESESRPSTSILEEDDLPFMTRRPQIAVGLNTSLNAFGSHAIHADQGTRAMLAFTVLAEYQPAVVQSFGVLGIGPSLALYQAPGSPLGSHFFAMRSIGGQIRYQARYFQEQGIVPFVSYAADYFSYQFKNGKSGSVFGHGPSLGLWFLLNTLDPSSAANFYADTRILRSYITLEYKTLVGSDDLISMSGGSVYFGLRFEL